MPPLLFETKKLRTAYHMKELPFHSQTRFFLSGGEKRDREESATRNTSEEQQELLRNYSSTSRNRDTA